MYDVKTLTEKKRREKLKHNEGRIRKTLHIREDKRQQIGIQKLRQMNEERKRWAKDKQTG